MIQLIRNLNFRYLFSSIFIFHICVLSASIVQGWIIFDLTNSPSALGLIQGSVSILALLFVLIGGVLSDAYEKKKVIMVFSLFMGLAILFLSVYYQFITIQIEHVVLISFILVLETFYIPSYASLIPEIVEKRDIIKANSAIEFNFGLAGLFAPLFTTFLYQTHGVITNYFFLAFTLLSSAFLIMFLTNTGSFTKKSINLFNLAKITVNEYYETFRFLKTSPILILSLVVLFITCVFCWSLTTMLPVLIKDHLNMGVDSLAYLHMAATGAIVIAGLLFTSLKVNFSPRLMFLILGTGLIFPIFMGLVGYSTNYIMTVIFYTLTALFGSSNHLLFSSLIQYRSPVQFRGKILSLQEISGTFISISSVFVGPLVGSIGITNTFVSLSLLTSLLIALSFLFYYKYNDDELEKTY